MERRLDYVGVLHKGALGKERGQFYGVSVNGITIVESSADAAFDACLHGVGIAGRIGFHHEGDPMIGHVTRSSAAPS